MGRLISDKYETWKAECNARFAQLKANEEELNRIFIDIYGLQDELTPEVADKDVTVHYVVDSKDDIPESLKGSNYILTKRDNIVSLISYAVGCMFGRYSLDVDGLVYAGGDFDSVYRKGLLANEAGYTLTFGGTRIKADSEYTQINDHGTWKDCTFSPDEDGVLPITDDEYFDDDIVGLFCAWLKKVYGADTLEKNLDFIAAALGNKGDTSREIIRNYFLNDFYTDHLKTYQKRPIYWLYDSGKQNGFKALIYLHRYDTDTTGRVRANYLHRMEKVYESEIGRMTETIENSKNNREVAKATKRREKLQKQLKECREYDEKIAHLALARIEIDLDDGVKVNYRKVQTDKNGKFYEILADSKNIMAKK